MVHEQWVDFVGKIKRYYAFSIEENRNFIIATLILGFCYSFRDWGIGENINFAYGFTNLIIITAFFGITLYVRLAAQKLHALRLGYKPEFRIWPYGLMGALIICFISNGVIVLPFYGVIELHVMLKHRLGHFRYHINMVNLGLVALMGSFANLLFAYLIKIVNISLQLPILDRLILLNLLLSVLALLPIPPMIDGVKVFYWSRLSYVFNFVVILVSAILIWYTANIFFIIIGSVFVATIVYIIYYLAYEEDKFGV